MGYQNIGPNYWQGETGRKALIEGTTGYNEGGFLEAFEALAAWQPLLGRRLPGCLLPRRAKPVHARARVRFIRPAPGKSAASTDQATFEMGAFKPPPVAGQDTCYISDHTDIAMGVNADSPNQEAALVFFGVAHHAGVRRTLLETLCPAFSSLSNHEVTLQDPLAQEFVSWRGECESTMSLVVPDSLARRAQQRKRPLERLGANLEHYANAPRSRRPSPAGAWRAGTNPQQNR